MNVLKREFVVAWLLGARVAIAADAPAAASVAAPPTAVPVVGVSLTPLGDVFKSWADYRYELDLESELPGGRDKFSGVNVISMETHIRRADTGQEVARIPFQGAIGSELYDERPRHIEFLADMKTYPARNASFPDDQVKALDKNPPGEYLLAVYVNGVRASNVVKVRINPAFDAAKAPALQLAGLEPDPRAQYGLVYFWIIGPTPPDPILQTRFLTFSFTVDGAARKVELGMGSGPSGHALASGERKVVFVNGGNGWTGHDVYYNGSVVHTFTVSISGTATRGLLGEMGTPSTQPSHYEARPLTFDPKAHPLGDAWDEASPPGEKRPIAPPASAPPAGTGIPPPPVTEMVPTDAASVMQRIKGVFFSGIIIPNVPMSAAIASLNHTAAVSAKVKIVIQPNSPRPYPDPVVNIDGSYVTLADVFDNICKTSGFTWAVENGTVVFRPPVEKTP